MSEEKKNLIRLDLQDRICKHIARGDDKVLFTIKEYHMEDVISISDYMIEFVGDWLYNARVLNQFFYMAVSELGIDLGSMYLIPDKKTVEKRQNKLSLGI